MPLDLLRRCPRLCLIVSVLALAAVGWPSAGRVAAQAPAPGLQLLLQVNQPVLGTGATLRVDIGAVNTGGAVAADFLWGLILPGGSPVTVPGNFAHTVSDFFAYTTAGQVSGTATVTATAVADATAVGSAQVTIGDIQPCRVDLGQAPCDYLPTFLIVCSPGCIQQDLPPDQPYARIQLTSAAAGELIVQPVAAGCAVAATRWSSGCWASSAGASPRRAGPPACVRPSPTRWSAAASAPGR